MAITDPFNPDLKEHAEAIGYVCVNWSWLEFIVECVLSEFLDMPADKPEAHIVTSSIDFRKKLDVIKAIGFMRKPSTQWFAQWEGLINHIDNSLRPERNRYVHDLWRKEPDRPNPSRISSQVKLVTPKARAERILQTSETVEVDIKEVRNLAAAIRDAAVSMVRLLGRAKLLHVLPPTRSGQ
jgi:hypothetical protein